MVSSTMWIALITKDHKDSCDVRVRPSHQDHVNGPQLRSFLCLKSRSYLPFSVERCVFSVVIRMLTVSTEPTDKKYVCNNVLNVHIVASIIATMCSWILQRNDL